MHTVTKAITDNIRDPELMVNAFRAMFGKQSVEFYVQQRAKTRHLDDCDYVRIKEGMLDAAGVASPETRRIRLHGRVVQETRSVYLSIED